MKFVQLFDRAQIEARARELGREISSHYGDEPVVCVCVLKGAYAFFTDLMRNLTIHPTMDFVRLSSYADQTSRKSKMVFSKDMEIDIRDKHVLVVEDNADAAESLAELLRCVGVGVGLRQIAGETTGEVGVIVMVKRKLPPAGLPPGAAIRAT